MSRLFRIYNDNGSIGIQFELLEDALSHARNKSKCEAQSIIDVCYCDPSNDLLEDDGIGIINEDQEFVAEFFRGELLRVEFRWDEE